MKIVFMGSPIEAVEALKILIERQVEWGVSLAAVVSQPARPAGRRKVLQDPPVAMFAKQQNIPTLQPERAGDAIFLETLRSFKPDVIVTAAYGQILTTKFLDVARRATINIHPSLLPKYRGATPVPSALLIGDTISGVTILFTVKKLDAGNIIAQRHLEFGETRTAGELMPSLFRIGGEMLGDAFAKLADETFTGDVQDEALVTHCGKFTKDDGLVNWSDSAVQIMRRFRAFTPWPGIFTFHNGVRIKLIRVRPVACQGDLQPGHFQLQGEDLLVGTADGCLQVERLMKAGSKETDGKAFMNGLKPGVPKYFDANEA